MNSRPRIILLVLAALMAAGPAPAQSPSIVTATASDTGGAVGVAWPRPAADSLEVKLAGCLRTKVNARAWGSWDCAWQTLPRLAVARPAPPPPMPPRDTTPALPPPPPPAPTPVPGGDIPPAGFRLLTRNTFDSGILAAGWTGQPGYLGDYKIESDPAVSRDGSPYLALLVPQGHAQGTGFNNLQFRFDAEQCREVAYSFWFRSTPTVPYGSNVQKLLHWWGPTGSNTTGSIGNVGLTNVHIGTGGYFTRAAYQAIEPTNIGAGSTGWKAAAGVSNYAQGAFFGFDRWVRIEGRLKFNTVDTPAGADGYHVITRTAPGGVATVEAKNLLWTVDVPLAQRTWRWVDIDPTIPGSVAGGPSTPAPYTLYFDDFVVGCR